jgi:hypothetical protein
MTPQEKYDEIVSKYPCPHRVGMGYAGCTCNNTYHQDPKYVNCEAYAVKNMHVTNCTNCPFRPVNAKQVIKG